MLKIAIQKSGRLFDDSIGLLKECGIDFNNGNKQLKAVAHNFPLEVYFFRDDDIPQYVFDNIADVGIVGENVLLEKNKDVKLIHRLGFGRCRLSIAVPKNSSYKSINDLNGLKIATSYSLLLNKFLKDFPSAWEEFDALLTRNTIFMHRCLNVGPISAEKAIAYGFTGPNLRAAGVDYDIRVATPYCSYEDFEFDIPVGKSGDTFDRYMVRQYEVRESIKIIRQALEKMPKEGGFHADVPDYYLPPKQDVYNNMEALIYHFKIIMGEIPVPKGEVYHAVEGGNGELGFYLISDGSRVPFRLHFRRPSFIYYQGFTEMIKRSRPPS